MVWSLRPSTRGVVALLGAGASALVLAGGASAIPPAPTITGGPPNNTWVTVPPSYTIVPGAGTGTPATFNWNVTGPQALSGTGASPDLSPLDTNGSGYSITATTTDPTGTGPPSAAHTFHLDSTAPTTPVLTSPADNFVTNTVTQPIFTWQASSDGHSGLSHYVVTVGAVTSPNIAAGTTTWQPPAPLPEAATTWRVTAFDNVGNSAQSTPRNITIDTVAPSGVNWSLNPSSPNGLAGWYTSNVTVSSPSCTDPFPSSGIASCTGGGTHSSNGTNLSFSNGAATDDAGNSASGFSSPVVKIDKSDPNDTGVTAPSDGSKTNLLRPTFSWNPALDNGPSGVKEYDVVIDGSLAATIPTVGPLTFTPSSDLTETGHTWFVRARDNAGNTEDGPASTFTIDTTAPAAPTITTAPPNPTNSASNTYSWSGLPGVTGYRWRVLQGTTTVAGPTEVPAATTSLILNTPSDGTYTFVLEQKTFGNYGAEATHQFRVDTQAPAPPTLAVRPPDSSTDTTPTFSWTGEALGTYRWQILLNGGVVQQGDSLANQITAAPLAPGAYVFRVRQTDDAGNVGGFSTPDGFTIEAPAGPATTPAPAPAPTTTTTKTTTKTTTTATPAVANTKRLKPNVGSVVTTLRPTLRWNRRAGATIYNIQIFELGGPKGRQFKKILSRFPVRNTFRVPAGKLRYGKRYVWRVWPFLGAGRTAASSPVGVSFFDLRRPKLSAVLAKRLVSPRAAKFAKAKKMNVRWKRRSGSRFYRVELRRGKKVVYRATTRRLRTTVPAARLRSKGSYTIVVRASIGKSRAKFHRVTWARGTFKRT